MANRYVWSGAAGAGTGADWANAFTTLTLAIVGATAGDVYYVAQDHAESTAGTVTLAFPGTAAAPDRVLCVNRAGSVPPVAADLTTGAVVATTGNTNIAVNNAVSIEGVEFRAGVGATGTCQIQLGNSAHAQRYRNCIFNLATTGTSSRITPTQSNISGRIDIIDCKAKFGHVSQAINPGAAEWRWEMSGQDFFASGSSIPTTLFVQGGASSQFEIANADLSLMVSGKTLTIGNTLSAHRHRIINCKLDSAVTVFGSPAAVLLGVGLDLLGCDSGATAARNERHSNRGSLVTETTIIRTGGASDGTTPYSWKITTTANPEIDFPFECFEGAIWNEDTGVSKTLTVHTVTDNVTLTDAEIWLEADYLGSALTPVASTISDGPATVLTAGANQTTSTETWTTTGIGTPVKQQLEVTFTPNMIGPIRWRVKVAKASTTVYICPKPEIA